MCTTAKVKMKMWIWCNASIPINGVRPCSDRKGPSIEEVPYKFDLVIRHLTSQSQCSEVWNQPPHANSIAQLSDTCRPVPVRPY